MNDERTDKNQSGSACFDRTGTFVKASDTECRHGTLGYGSSDQFEYYLYDGYAAEAGRDSGAWCGRICNCIWNRHVYIPETYFFKKINIKIKKSYL